MPDSSQCKLELVVGSPASCMELELYGADEKFCCKLDQEDALLGSYPVDNGCRIHVSPLHLGSLLSLHACHTLPNVITQIGPHGARSPLWKEGDPSPDSDSQSGLGWGKPRRLRTPRRVV